jgi:hypothetical protein
MHYAAARETAKRMDIMSCKKKNFPKWKHEGRDAYVEEALNQWFYATTGRGERDSGPLLKRKSEELANSLGHSNSM